MTTRLPDARRSVVLLVGVWNYTKVRRLDPVRNNLADLRDLLTDPDTGAFTRDTCVVVAEPATIEELGSQLRQAVTRAEDTLVVYFAGHGLLDEDGQLHLALRDSDPENVPDTAYPVARVRANLGGAQARNRVLILDCCFSGRAINAMTDRGSLVSGQIDDIKGTYTLASSAANVPAIARDVDRNTLFSGELIELLRHGSTDLPALLSLGDIYRELRRRTFARGAPEPQSHNTGLADRLALARNVAHAPSGEAEEPRTPHRAPPPRPRTVARDRSLPEGECQEQAEGQPGDRESTLRRRYAHAAALAQVSGHAADARQLLDEVWGDCRQALGSDHPLTVRCRTARDETSLVRRALSEPPSP